MKNKWIVIANRVEARIFKDKPFDLIETLTNNLGREKNRAMTTDKPGRGKSGYSGSPDVHAMTGEKDPHEDAAIQFARTICRYLEGQDQAHNFEELVIAAEPKMMGRIRSHMDTHLSENVHWIKKDLGHLNKEEIGKKLRALKPTESA